MSATQFKDDLTQPGVGEEPRASSNAGMNLALMLTVGFSLILLIWAIVAAPHNNYAMNAGPSDSASSVGQTTNKHTTIFNNASVSTQDDKSNASGQEVQGTAPSSPARY